MPLTNLFLITNVHQFPQLSATTAHAFLRKLRHCLPNEILHATLQFRVRIPRRKIKFYCTRFMDLRRNGIPEKVRGHQQAHRTIRVIHNHPVTPKCQSISIIATSVHFYTLELIKRKTTSHTRRVILHEKHALCT